MESVPVRRHTITLLCAAQFVVVLDATIVAVALPAIGRDLGVSGTGLAWVVSAYGLVFGGFLMLFGRTADLLGRRRVLIAGFALFAAAVSGPPAPPSAGFRVACSTAAAVAATAALIFAALHRRG